MTNKEKDELGKWLWEITQDPFKKLAEDFAKRKVNYQKPDIKLQKKKNDPLKLYQYFNLDESLPKHEERQHEFVHLLKNDLQGKRGKYIAFMLRGLERRKINLKPILEYQDRKGLFNAIKLEVGIKFSNESVYKYMESRFPQSKIDENSTYQSEFQKIQYKIETFLQSIGISA